MLHMRSVRDRSPSQPLFNRVWRWASPYPTSIMWHASVYNLSALAYHIPTKWHLLRNHHLSRPRLYVYDEDSPHTHKLRSSVPLSRFFRRLQSVMSNDILRCHHHAQQQFSSRDRFYINRRHRNNLKFKAKTWKSRMTVIRESLS